MYDLAEPADDQAREPDEEKLRNLKITEKNLATGICTPGKPPCNFIEDSFLPLINFAGTMAEL